MAGEKIVFSSGRMTKTQAMHLNPRQWAFVGDTVYSLYVKTVILTRTDYPLAKMHKLSVSEVNSSRQAEIFDAIEPLLGEEERDILRRGRRIRTRSSHSRNDPGEYSKSTALEGLVGFLYLTGQDERLEEIMDMIFMSNIVNEDKT